LRLTDGFARVDLWKGRVLLSNTSLLHREEDLLKPLEKPRTSNLRLVDKFGNVESILGQVSTARVPRYLVKSPQHYPRSLRYESIHDSPVKVIGFGERFVAGKTRDGKFDFHYQAPELVLDSQLTTKADIWSLGCLVYSFMYSTLDIADHSQRSTA